MLIWLALLIWVFIGEGAATLTSYLTTEQKGLMFFDLTETRVKILSVVIVAAGLFSLFGQQQV
jgi:hypothetical protein